MEFTFKQLQNPKRFAVNRMKAHSDHEWYPSKIAAEKKENKQIMSLNGEWQFAYAENEAAVPAGFESLEMDCHTWDMIHVPGHIQMQGYDRPQYVNQQYPWDGLEDVPSGKAPVRFNPVACYVRYIDLPKSFEGKRVFISFQGVESCVAVWLNGTYIGYSSNSFSPCEFELTDAMMAGENKLALRVYKWNCGSWLEDQDFYRFSGIYRDVYLYAVEDSHIQDLKITNELNDAFDMGKLRIQGTFLAKCKENKNLMVRAGLSGVDADGHKVSLKSEAAAKEKQFTLSFKVAHPQLWSAEAPALYDLTIEIVDAGGAVKEVIKERTAFRRFEMKDGLMHLNGKRIVFKGVNRHDFDASVGRAVTKEMIERDLLTMKRNNINAIRTSHYPNNAYLYKRCDELGLYLIAENNMETHGTWQNSSDRIATCLPGDRSEWQPMMLDRVDATYETAKNHPAVLIWSVGNESYGGTVIKAMAEHFRELDQSRLVHYEGVFNDRRYSEESSDMESRMYPYAAEIESYIQAHPERPFICCEYAHSMGNSTGALDYYTKLADKYPQYQGGFIWDYMDQAIKGKDRYGNTAYFYGGDMDERPTDYSFSGNGICYPDGSESPKMAEVKYDYRNIEIEFEQDRFIVKNKNLFVSTSEWNCLVSVKKNGQFLMASFVDTDVAPLSETAYELPFGKLADPGEYAVVVSFITKEDKPWAKAGHEVAFGEWIYVVKAAKKASKVKKQKKLEILDTDFNIGVIGEDFRVLFTKLEGGLSSYVYHGREMLKTIMKPNFWRPMTENDLGGQLELHMAQWKIASEFVTHRQFGKTLWHPDYFPVFREEDGCALVTFNYHMPTTPASDCTVTYTVHPDGTVDCELDYKAVEGLSAMPEFGMLVKMSADFDHLTWYGRGPQECYADRCNGLKLGIYEGKVKDQMAAYLRPQESGNHTEVRWAKVTDENGLGLEFMGDAMNFSALPWTPHEIDCAAHPYELPPIHYTVVRPALAQMGVGGDDTWGSVPHREFWLPEGKNMTFRFSFKGVMDQAN